MLLPVGHVTHCIQTRIRIHIPSKQRDVAYFAVLGDKLSKCAGVDHLQVNPLTGSLLMLHHIDVPAISRYAEENELFKLVPIAPSAPVSAQIASHFSALDQRLQLFSGGKIDLSSTAFFGLTMAGLFQLLRRNIWPAGLTLLWYAASVLPKRYSRRDAKL